MNPDLLPMLAGRSYQTVPSTTGFTAWAEPKLDGWRAIIHVVADDDVRVYGGRNGSNYTGRVPYIESALCHLPPDTVLDGELVSSTDWGMVQSIMTTQQSHVPSKLSPPVNFYVFDMLRLDGHDIRNFTWRQRRRLVEAKSIYGDGKLVRPTLLLPATNEMLTWVLAQGFEGLVLKDPGSSYVNKRSNSWAKVKPTWTDEVLCTGFEPGKGSFRGIVGAIRFRLSNGVESSASGMTMAVREHMTTHPHEYIGKIIEISHHGVMPSGSVRHPQYRRVRFDRVQKEWEQTAPPPSGRLSSVTPEGAGFGKVA